MKKLILTGLACASMLALANTGFAHGGTYRGPGDTVPPNSGGGRKAPTTPTPTTPGPAAPGAPAPAAPTTPNPSGPPAPATGTPSAPAGAKAATTGPRGMAIGDDLTKWQFWWEFNKDPFINLKDAIHRPETTTGSDDFYMGRTRRVPAKDTAKPSKTDIEETILPALKRALDSTDQRDITSSCLIALAKIGQDHPKWDGGELKSGLLKIILSKIDTFDQEIRETCALAMGISAKTEAIGELVNLALDNAAGRKRINKTFVDDRTRSFAVYGLGLTANRTTEAKIKLTVLETCKTILNDKKVSDRNIRVAALNAIGLLNADRQGESDPKSVLNQALDTLDEFYARKLGRGEKMIQSHVPPAVAKLLGRGKEGRRAKYISLWVHELKRSGGKKAANDIYRAAAIGLGQLAPKPEDDKKLSDESKALFNYFQKGKDQQAKYFSLMSMGQIGGIANKTELLKVLRKGKKVLERPWAAMALGVYSYNLYESDKENAGKETDLIGEELAKQFRDVKVPEARSAFAVALGLARYQDAAGDLMDALMKYKHQDEFAGYICIGLSLMNYGRAKGDIHEIVRSAVRRPDLLKQAAIALGKLGDRSVTDTLTKMLSEESSNLAKLSAIANALSFIGDRRTIQPLKKMLFNDSLGELSRAFAAVALGGVADKENLPWNSKISRNMNYRASVETLTGSGAGILDIL